MALPSPFFALNQFQKQELSQTPKVSKFYRDPQQQQSTQIKREFISFCKYCKEGFKNDFELNQHRRNHVKCPYDECRFNANESTVASHVQKVHIKQSGLVKIQDLTTPEQIEKWREERRKRYPTVQNVILRQKLQEEKFKRGERLKESYHKFGDQKQRNFIKNMGKRDHHSQNKHKKSRNNHLKNKIERGKAKEINEIVESSFDNSLQKKSDSSDEEMHHKVLKFSGTSQIKEDPVEKVVKENSALSILGLYGSDSECSDDDNDEENTSQDKIEQIEIPQNESNNNLTQNDECENFEMSVNETKNDTFQSENDDEAPEEIPTLKQSNQEISEEKTEDPTSKSRKRKRHQKNKLDNQSDRNYKISRKNGLDYSRIKRSGNPFLEKLLERDIVHERNVLLQCVNFVVKNNFFGVGQKSDLSKNAIINE
ncbi:hypothetical protein PVAND_005656 [Polypedilum vanderplanki]|uniref:C2H2-type domain-containing protein n=1 Tax=Polypedilum vanderplanki TaxID=319348 RepID=A0A9J6C2Q2_POLVA|nr:hypothetical protein PVAND_005656 [Polypedilum vanderplanki]